jgi:hypothetical protein
MNFGSNDGLPSLKHCSIDCHCFKEGYSLEQIHQEWTSFEKEPLVSFYSLACQLYPQALLGLTLKAKGLVRNIEVLPGIMDLGSMLHAKGWLGF